MVSALRIGLNSKLSTFVFIAMTYTGQDSVSLTGRDWFKLAAGALLQAIVLLVTSYCAVSSRVAVVETELRLQRDLFDEKLNTLRVEVTARRP